MRITSTKTVYANRWLTVREDRVIHADGSTGLFGVVEKQDFSLVVPSHNGGFYLVEQYRHAARGRFWEFPQGSPAAPGTALSPLDVAAAELQEETGIAAGRIEHLGTVHEAYGYATPRGHIYVASDLSFGEPAREATESDMRCEWFDRPAVWGLVDRGLLTDAPSLAALALLQRRTELDGISPGRVSR